MKPVRVLHLIDGLGGGGSERWIWDIVRLSPSNKVKHFVITILPDKGDFVYAKYLREKGAYGQKISHSISHLRGKVSQTLKKTSKRSRLQRIAERAWRFACYVWAFWHVLKALMWFRPDVVHVHTFHGFTGGILVKLIFRRCLVHTVPALFSQMNDAGFHWMLKKYARLHSQVDLFFTGASLTELLSVGVPAEKIKLIRGTMDFNSINPITEERAYHRKNVRKNLNLPANALLGLSVGRLHSSKGHHFSLEALPSILLKFPRFYWLVLGEGTQREELEERAKELGIASHVHFIGFQPNPWPYYAAADLYLRTGVFEAENLSSHQAMAFGVPVVGFNTGCETELISSVKHGTLVNNRDAVALARGIEQVLGLPDCGREMGSRGEMFAKTNLDIQQSIEEFISGYFTLLNRFSSKKVLVDQS